MHLFFLYDVQTGLVWATKILTDPFNDVKLYHKAPYYLFVKGELIDPHTDEQEDESEDLFQEEPEEAPRAS